MITPSLNAGLEILQALAEYLDQGSANATFVFYDDAKPSSTAVSADEGAKLVTLTLPKPCFKSLQADHIELEPTDTATVIKSGTAVWARLYNGNNAVVADFAVGTDISLANTALVLGGTLGITSIKLSPPTGT